MRKMSLFLSIYFLLLSCNYKIYPPKSSYPEPPFIQQSEKSFEKVWDNIIDFFAQKGIAISLIDKNSGLIISVETDLAWSSENRKTGQIVNPEAWVVINNIYSPGPNKYIKPARVSGKWNIRVKSEGSGSTINVNLHDLTAYEYEYTRSGTPYEVPITRSFKPKTTGVFEKMISDIIK